MAFTANFVDEEGDELSITSVNIVTWYMSYIWDRRWQNLAIIADGSAYAKAFVESVAKMPPKFWTELDIKNAKAGIILPPTAPIDAFRLLLDSVLLHEVSWASQRLFDKRRTANQLVWAFESSWAGGGYWWREKLWLGKRRANQKAWQLRSASTFFSSTGCKLTHMI